MSTQQDKHSQVQLDDMHYHLHPYTNARKNEEHGPLVIVKGDGVYVEDVEGKRYFEAMSGLWSVGLGFSNKRLVDAAVKQLHILPFYHSFTQKTHDLAARYAKKLLAVAPKGMGKVFYTNSGSEANDTVIKLIWYRSNALGLPNKKKIISRQKAYHGVTIASASLTGLPGNHNGFDLPIDRILHTACPHYWRFGQEGESEQAFATRLANELEALILKEGPETIAAFFAEPLMGAGGVILPPDTYWEKIQAVLKKYDILLVADEVICGFGRTGNMFGCETYNIDPDFLVLSKQITSSYQPLSAILLKDEIYQTIADQSNQLGVLGHGFTAGGHPVAIAVAEENLNIIQEDKLVEAAATVGQYMQKRLRELETHPLVGEVRGIALIAGVELVLDKANKKAFDTPGQLGTMVQQTLQGLGVINRNIGDTLAFCPPLISKQVHIDEMVDKLKQALDLVLAKLS